MQALRCSNETKLLNSSELSRSECYIYIYIAAYSERSKDPANTNAEHDARSNPRITRILPAPDGIANHRPPFRSAVAKWPRPRVISLNYQIGTKIIRTAIAYE